MRATRAYLAGFGTSGSLLAGAALMFVLASAIIAFRGWPQVANPSSPVAVSLPSVNTGAGSRASRLLLAGGAAQAGRAQGAAGALGPGGVSHLRGAHGRITFSSSTTPGSAHGTVGLPSAQDVSTSSGHSCTSGCKPAPPPNPLPQAVSKTLDTATSTAKSVVTTVKKILPKTVSSAGSTPSGTTSKLSGTTSAGSSLP